MGDIVHFIVLFHHDRLVASLMNDTSPFPGGEINCVWSFSESSISVDIWGVLIKIDSAASFSVEEKFD